MSASRDAADAQDAGAVNAQAQLPRIDVSASDDNHLAPPADASNSARRHSSTRPRHGSHSSRQRGTRSRFSRSSRHSSTAEEAIITDPVRRRDSSFSIFGQRPLTRSSTITEYHSDASHSDHARSFAGAEPGIDTTADGDELLPEHLSNLKAECDINIIDYSEDQRTARNATNATLAKVLDEPRPEGMPCRWISVNGLSWDVIRIIGNKYHLHQLAIEDLIHTRSRTKVDWFSDHAQVILTLQKLVRLHRHDNVHGECSKCEASVNVSDLDEKVEPPASDTWFRWRRAKRKSVLPTHSEKDTESPFEDTVAAYSTTSRDSPIKEIRTLHRYENSQIPEHTAWMEKHSALTADNLAVSVEQVCLFLLSDNTVISFFEQSAGDIEKPILARLESRYTVLRRSCDASMLLQAIVDAIVDLASPVKEAYNKARKELQIAAMTHPDIRTSRALHIFGEEIDMLQNLFKPIVHLVNALRDHNADALYNPNRSWHEAVQEAAGPEQRASHLALPAAQPNKSRRDRDNAALLSRPTLADSKRTLSVLSRGSGPSVTISPLAHTYFGDVLDHCITTIGALEQMDASAQNISDLIFNTVSAKTNNFMMILAVVTVFFAPLTFISGYFGMNFESGAGLDHPFDYFFVVASPSVVGFMMLVYAIYQIDAILEWIARKAWGARMQSLGMIRRRRMP